MPNHVTTEIKAAKHVLDFLATSEREVDFNTVIPFPEQLRNITAEVKVFPTRAEAFDYNAAENARRAGYDEVMKNLLGLTGNEIHALAQEDADILKKEFGALHWYNWNIENWGTKWNAYDVERVDETTLRFETAWAHPDEVLEALSKRWPDEVIAVAYADEDLGSNMGAYVIENGVKTDMIDFEAMSYGERVQRAHFLKYKEYMPQEEAQEWGIGEFDTATLSIQA